MFGLCTNASGGLRQAPANPKNMTEREEILREALGKILDWANAYPDDVFPDQDLKKADAVLQAAGISMSAMYGEWGRHISRGIKSIAERAI